MVQLVLIWMFSISGKYLFAFYINNSLYKSSIKMEEIPSLQQICYDLLAQYAGYIEDLEGVNNIGIREICKRTNAFGLANIESLSLERQEINTSVIWETIYTNKLKTDPSYITSLAQLTHGQDFSRQAVLASMLKYQLACNEMDDEDLCKLLSFCERLKILEINKITRLDFSTIFARFSHLLHFSLENSKLGPGSAYEIKGVIDRCPFLQTLNLKNCILKDEGAALIAESLRNSKVCKVDMSWNDLSFVSIQLLCLVVSQHFFLSIVILSRNLGPRDIKKGQNLVNQIRLVRKILITVV